MLFGSGEKAGGGPVVLFSCIHRCRFSAWVSTDCPQSLWRSRRGKRKNDDTFRHGNAGLARDGGKLPCGRLPLASGGIGVPPDPWIAALFPKRFSPENGKTEETRPEKDQRPGLRDRRGNRGVSRTGIGEGNPSFGRGFFQAGDSAVGEARLRGGSGPRGERG